MSNQRDSMASCPCGYQPDLRFARTRPTVKEYCVMPDCGYVAIAASADAAGAALWDHHAATHLSDAAISGTLTRT